MKRMTVALAALFAAGALFGGALDFAWIKGRTDKNPIAYKSGEKMVFTLSFEGIDGAIPEGEYFLDWNRSGDDGLRDGGRVPLTGQPFVYETRIDKPGFVRLQAHVVDKAGKRYTKTFTGDSTTPEGREALNRFERQNKAVFFDGGAGADVEALRTEPEPKDFDAFWAKQFARLDKVPIAARKIEVEHPDAAWRGKVRRYAIEIDCAGLRPVTGYLHVPNGVDSGKTYPARLVTHGYSGDSFRKFGEGWHYCDNAIVLDINAHGMRLPAFGADDAYYKEFRWEIRSHDMTYAFDPKQNADPELAYFNGMVLRVKRALQFLKTLKGWNGRDLIAVGGSQGGLQTIWAAACGEGVTRAESGITWNCDMYTNGKLRKDPSLKLAADDWYIPWVEALGYYDAAIFAKRIPKSCRTVITRAGLGDYCCPPTGLAKLWNNIPGNKEIHWVQGSQHGYVPPPYEGRDVVRTSVAGDGRADKGIDTPLFRVGWLSDTHTRSTRASFDLVQKAMALFRRHGVDAVIHSGDISEHYDPAGYALYRQVTDEAFAGAEKKPLEIYAWAWHDAYEWNGPGVGDSTAAERTACYADVSKRLGIRHRMADRFEIGGHIFLLFPQWKSNAEWKGRRGMDAYELMLQEAERDCGGRPIFIVDHEPPARTVTNSAFCEERTRAVLSKHPGVISLSGHVHGSLWDENHIWQGEFTAVNAASLHAWGRDGYCVLVIEGFGDRIVFRRFDVRNGQEVARESPWTVPWPFDPKTAPYSFERRVRATPVPAFAEDARVAVQANEPFTGFTLILPPIVVGADSAYLYRVSIAEGTADGWRRFKTTECSAQFNLWPSERRESERLPFSAGYFTAGRRYRFEVSPVNFFGVAGKPAYGEATAPDAKPAKVVWESANPMDELKFVYGDDGTDGGRPVEKKDGWYEDSGAMTRLVIPPTAWKVPNGTKLRFTVDLETVQAADPGTRTYNLAVMRFKPRVEMVCGYLNTRLGDSGLQRYVIEFTKTKDVPYNLVLGEAKAGKVRFHSVKVSRLDP